VGVNQLSLIRELYEYFEELFKLSQHKSFGVSSEKSAFGQMSLFDEEPPKEMANWSIQVTEDWLQSIYDKLRSHLLKNDLIHADETTFQVLKEPEKSAETRSYMWLYRTSGDAKSPAGRICVTSLTRHSKFPNPLPLAEAFFARAKTQSFPPKLAITRALNSW